MTIHQLLSGPRVAHDGAEPAGGTSPAATPPAATPWYNGADAELVGHIQAQGWHDKPANEVALEAISQARRNAAFNGVPVDKLVRLPDGPADEVNTKALWTKLGVPADAKDYDFSTLKDAAGQPLLSDARADFLRQTAHKLNIPAEAAVRLAQELVGNEGSTAAAAAAEKTAALADEHKALDANWGQNKEANLFLARKGAEKLGLTPENVAALEGVVGFAKVMEAMRQVGELSGEAKFVGGNTNFNGGLMTREQAVARKSELMKDGDWAKRKLAGGTAENREMAALNAMIVGDDTEASRYR